MTTMARFAALATVDQSAYSPYTPQVVVVPCRANVFEEAGKLAIAIPANAEAVAVDGRCAGLCAQALVDKGMFRREKGLVEIDGRARQARQWHMAFSHHGKVMR